MAMLWEKVVVTANEFLTKKNINECSELSEPMFQTKQRYFGWDLQFSASSILCEVVWKIAIGKDSLSEWNELDRLFSPSPIATHSNFRGNKTYRTGNKPEPGAIVFWRRGNTWQGHMAIVTNAHDDGKTFDVVDGRALTSSTSRIISVEERLGKQIGLPFSADKLNFMGFVYPKNQEIR